MFTQRTIFLAKTAIAAVLLYNIVLTALIFIKPDLDPYWHTISEYAFGSFGWMMTVAFLSSALAYICIFLIVKNEIHSVLGKIGLVILFACILGTVGVGLFKTDPLTTPQDMISATGMIHMFCGGLALVLLPFAALFVNLGFAKQVTGKSKKIILITGLIPILGLLGFIIHFICCLAPLGENAYGPGVPIGYPPRLLFVSYMIWVIVLASQVIKKQMHQDK